MATEASASPVGGTLRPGDTIDGKYALVRVLGTGGMGVVYEAEHLRLKQRCAIKMLSPEMLREADIVHRFEREARASALLKSPHVTRVTDVATTPEGVPYMVMEAFTGHDLDSELQSRGRLPYQQAVDYLLQACAAVAEAHGAGIIHRDLKPGNLFLAQESEGVIVKVLDFGISKIIEEDSKLTSAGMTMGTALYMSPEQLRSAAKVDARSDIWSLGVILYELLCGEPPFVGTPTQIAAAIVTEDAPDLTRRCPIPPALGAAIHRALRRSPAERFSTVAELASALVPFAAPNSLGVTVAAQISRRDSARQLNEPARSSDPQMSGAAAVNPEALTVAKDASTSVSHVVNTSARNDSSSRKLLIAALAVVALVATVGALTVVLVVLRRPGEAHPPAAAAAATTAATPTAAIVPEGVAQGEPATPVTTGAGTTSASPARSAAPTAAATKAGAVVAASASPVRPPRPAASTSPTGPTPLAAPTSSPTARPAPPARPPAGPAPTAPQFL